MSNKKQLKNYMTRVTDERAEELLEAAKKDPSVLNTENEKKYVVLYYATDKETDEEIKSWEVLQGRQAVYDFIKNMKEYMDMTESIVLVEGQTIDGAKSCYDFVEFVLRKNLVIDDPTFHIEEYIK